jgi:hypothetical protein
MRGLPVRTAVGLFALLFAESQINSAYEAPLASDAVRDAYFLGQRNDDSTSDFFGPYRKQFPMPQTGPYISQVELLTPYAQVVKLSQQKTTGYSAQDALSDYQNRGDSIVIYVRIEFTRTYDYPQAADSAKHAVQRQGQSLTTESFWRDFGFRLLAPVSNGNNTEMVPTAIRIRVADAIPTYARGQPLNTLAGSLVRLVYDAKDVASVPVSFEVIPPGGTKVVCNFDLSALR